MRDFIVAGLLVTPFVRSALLALLILLVLHALVLRIGLDRWFWHPLLAECAIYICLIALVDLAF